MQMFYYEIETIVFFAKSAWKSQAAIVSRRAARINLFRANETAN